MNKECNIEKGDQEIIVDTIGQNPVTEAFIKWKYKFNEKTGKQEQSTVELSDGSELNEKNLKRALKRATGTSDLIVGERILKNIACGIANSTHESRLNEISVLLPALQPRDETEALILGQFLALQSSGLKCLERANFPGQGFYHYEKCLILAHKLLNTANQTMQAALKYRSGGQQNVQVIHVHNDGRAIVAQNLSSSTGGQGSMVKTKIEPLGS